MIKIGIYLAERGLIPDFILNFFIQKISLGRVNSATTDNEKLTVIDKLKSGPIAEKTSDANDQHYEVPPAFFQLVLGKHMKYSCSQFNSKSDDLDQAEENMLQLYLDRAGIQANQKPGRIGTMTAIGVALAVATSVPKFSVVTLPSRRMRPSAFQIFHIVV